jgi:NADH dehydrogenase
MKRGRAVFALVVGATGVLGRETLRRLRAAGHRVRGMTRDARRIAEIEAEGAQAVIGDLTDAASLAHACAGVDHVFAAAHAALGRGRYRSEAVDDAGHRALIDAARNARVERFVYTSALGAAPDHPVDFFRTKWAIEQYLASSGLPYVVLRPSAFMEWHAHAFNGKGILDSGRTVILGTGTKPRNFVAVRDVAAIAARVITGEMPRQHVLAIGGPGNYTNDEVAGLYARIAGVPARVVHVPRAALAAMAPIARPLHPGVARVVRIASLPDDAFPEAFEAGRSAGQCETGETTLEEFVRERVTEDRAAASARR